MFHRDMFLCSSLTSLSFTSKAHDFDTFLVAVACIRLSLGMLIKVYCKIISLGYIHASPHRYFAAARRAVATCCFFNDSV